MGEHPGQWACLVDPLLFALWEIPQASMGFSPFELVFGRRPRGLMDILQEEWTCPQG